VPCGKGRTLTDVLGSDSEREWLTERFQQHRPHLRAVAYRMLGSVTEADDALQEALRIRDQDPGSVENMQAWLTTVVGRICLNMLRSRWTRREEELSEVHLPEPVVTLSDSADPEQQALPVSSGSFKTDDIDHYLRQIVVELMVPSAQATNNRPRNCSRV
jgi:DNA-directed RNA polymerase specialized sigma24 family protein